MRPWFLAVTTAAALLLSPLATAQAATPATFGFQSPLGTYNQASLQTGLAVYQANCAACHSIKAVKYRDLRGIGLTPPDITALTTGIHRFLTPSAKTGTPVTPNNRLLALHPTQPGAQPAPDLSLAAATMPHGPQSIVAFLRTHHPIKPGSVTLAHGKKPSVAVMTHDVATFLAWSADPTLTQRKSIMLRAMIFLAIFGVIGFIALRGDRARLSSRADRAR